MEQWTDRWEYLQLSKYDLNTSLLITYQAHNEIRVYQQTHCPWSSHGCCLGLSQIFMKTSE